MITNIETEELALLIASEIKNGFANKHLANVLSTHIDIINNDNETAIYIHAPNYNTAEYIDTGVVLYTNDGSFAIDLATEGSVVEKYRIPKQRPRITNITKKYYYGNHENFVEIAIKKAVEMWQTKYKGEIKQWHLI
jgi:hypothetical protein